MSYNGYRGYGENNDVDTEDYVADDAAVSEGADEEGDKDELDESLENIEEAKNDEEMDYDENGDYIGEDSGDFGDGNTDWAEPDATPQESDIPVNFEIIEAQGESMEAEGDAILGLLGPSDNDQYNKLVLGEDPTVSYPDKDGTIVTQQIDNFDIGDETTEEDVDGLSTDSNRDQYVSEDGGSSDDDGSFDDGNDGLDEDKPIRFSDDDYED